MRNVWDFCILASRAFDEVQRGWLARCEGYFENGGAPLCALFDHLMVHLRAPLKGPPEGKHGILPSGAQHVMGMSHQKMLDIRIQGACVKPRRNPGPSTTHNKFSAIRERMPATPH